MNSCQSDLGRVQDEEKEGYTGIKKKDKKRRIVDQNTSTGWPGAVRR